MSLSSNVHQDPALYHGKKIGLLGGSFNPAHEGHRSISLDALTHASLDEIWWLVSPANPLKDSHHYADYQWRCDRALAVADHPHIKISTIEQDANTRYTVDTLRVIKKMYPHADFVWLMGADSLAGFHRWCDWQKIASLLPMMIINRPGYEGDALESVAAKTLMAHRQSIETIQTIWTEGPPAWVFLTDAAYPQSSTAIRKDDPLWQSQKEQSVMQDAQIDPTIDIKLTGLTYFLDYNPVVSDFLSDVVEGLSKPQKSLSPKYFYDEYGSQLFEKITQTEEYYPTRTELKVMRAHMHDITDRLGAGAAIFEYGSGASEKIKLLLNSLQDPSAYVAMDISKEFLIHSAQSLAAEFTALPISAVCADFNRPMVLPETFHPEVQRWVGYFPGSTIGNFPAGAATLFLERMSDTLGPGAQLLLGFDLIKDPAILNAAYNDSEGITAAFNLNILTRMKRELNADLNIDDFAHYAFYNEQDHRIEMHLKAIRPTSITVNAHEFAFEEGETLHTEFSYKYNQKIMEDMVAQTSWSIDHLWSDEKGHFAVCLLSNDN